MYSSRRGAPGGPKSATVSITSLRVAGENNIGRFIFSLIPRLFIIKKKTQPGNLSEFKLLTSAALQLGVLIRFQNGSRDSCRISIGS